MYRFLRTPRWVAATVVVLVIVGAFVNLGLWQLRRLADRRASNQVLEARVALPPEDLTVMLEAVGSDLSSIEYHPAEVAGNYDPMGEVLLRSRTLDGVAGFHVLTPLVTDRGWAVLVNRGWVPLEMDTPPVPAAPPAGRVEVEGYVRLSEARPVFGPTDPPSGTLAHLSRPDLPRIQQQTEMPLAPVYLDLEAQRPTSPTDLPVPVDAPAAEDEGNHLSYAIQWFAFAAVGLIGYLVLVRRTARGVAGTRAAD